MGNLNKFWQFYYGNKQNLRKMEVFKKFILKSVVRVGRIRDLHLSVSSPRANSG